jgi:Protein of unknown function (DUF3769)/LptA/(LptD N-terminal domain) LPS transport protein
MPYFATPPQTYQVAYEQVVYETTPEEVKAGLRSLFESIPDLSRSNFVAQRGPIKPDSIPAAKPNDPAPLLPIPSIINGLPINVTSDQQEYNAKDQTFTAKGNVTVIYQKSQLKADVVKLNLVTKETEAEGNIYLKRGEQILRGSRLEYNYGTAKGSLANASGQINLGTATNPNQVNSDRGSRSTTVSIFGSNVPDALPNKTVGRVGFKADRLVLDSDRWYADNIRITNDPYSPPEVELRANRATLTPINEEQDRLDAESPSLVFDQGLSIPIPITSLVLDRVISRTLPIRLGFDRRDQGGLFYQQNFDIYTTSNINFQISPQLFLQRGLEGRSNFLDFALLGVAARLDVALPDSQFFSGKATLSSLNLTDAENQLRATLLYSRPILDNYTFVAQYSYRDRLFNGSLGFQDVRNSLGVNLFSPSYILGDTGIVFAFQTGAQYIGADRDRGASLPIDVASLIRLQGATSLNRAFPLWRGTSLPAEKELGLKYFPEPIVPGLDAILGVNANYSFYSSGEDQGFLSGTVGLLATLGNFSQPFFDYTKINISYTQGVVAGRSPFLFDRIADTQTFTVGILQQIYGPLRFGAEQTWNPGTGRIVDSNYSLQYDRRTYAIVIRYNPTREIGELVLRISDFNWGEPSSNITTVEGGVEQR